LLLLHLVLLLLLLLLLLLMLLLCRLQCQLHLPAQLQLLLLWLCCIPLPSQRLVTVSLPIGPLLRTAPCGAVAHQEAASAALEAPAIGRAGLATGSAGVGTYHQLQRSCKCVRTGL
jgi:hypothetical protein